MECCLWNCLFTLFSWFRKHGKDIDNLELELQSSEFKQCKALFTGCVTLSELIHFSDPYFLTCKKKEFFIGLQQGLDNIILIKCSAQCLAHAKHSIKL